MKQNSYKKWNETQIKTIKSEVWHSMNYLDPDRALSVRLSPTNPYSMLVSVHVVCGIMCMVQEKAGMWRILFDLMPSASVCTCYVSSEMQHSWLIINKDIDVAAVLAVDVIRNQCKSHRPA